MNSWKRSLYGRIIRAKPKMRADLKAKDTWLRSIQPIVRRLFVDFLGKKEI